MNIEQIKAHNWFGNHFSDRIMFNEVHNFVTNEHNSIADRAEALRIMSDKGMGCGRDEHISDDDIVADYLREST